MAVGCTQAHTNSLKGENGLHNLVKFNYRHDKTFKCAVTNAGIWASKCPCQKLVFCSLTLSEARA